MLWYHLIFSDNNKAIGYAWNLMGFVAKLAQGVGLSYTFTHRSVLLIACLFNRAAGSPYAPTFVDTHPWRY